MARSVKERDTREEGERRIKRGGERGVDGWRGGEKEEELREKEERAVEVDPIPLNCICPL